MVERSHDIQPSQGLTSSTHICHETVRPLQALPARPAPHQCALAGLRNSRSMQLHMVWTTKMYDITVYSSASFKSAHECHCHDHWRVASFFYQGIKESPSNTIHCLASSVPLFSLAIQRTLPPNMALEASCTAIRSDTDGQQQLWQQSRIHQM